MGKRENKLKIFSALEVANMCGVVNQTAINWIKNGYLKAFTTPGGQYRVYSENMIEFLQGRGMKIPDVLLPFVKDDKKEKKAIVIDSDPDLTVLFREKISAASPRCAVFTANTAFEAGVLIAKEKPQYIIISESIPEITPSVIRDVMGNLDMGGRRHKIIFLESINSRNDFAGSSDLVLANPPDLARITAFINSFP
ncbi:MAG: helix-turn-helix domain-containing protein [Spirochaetia bacterium]|jgi:hypothetical protein|nr:helix-turn-helix domain-containing protein [Spirochaetia bacterium]